jgi:hypothetical protein
MVRRDSNTPGIPPIWAGGPNSCHHSGTTRLFRFGVLCATLQGISFTHPGRTYRGARNDTSTSIRLIVWQSKSNLLVLAPLGGASLLTRRSLFQRRQKCRLTSQWSGRLRAARVCAAHRRVR